MAIVEIWQRGQVPQGRVALPAGENGLAEQFGGALVDLGETARRVAGQVAEADQIAEEKAWERLQPEMARDLAQAGLDWTEAYADMKEKAPEDLAGFQDQVKAWGDNRRDELLKKFPGQKAADYIDVHFADLMQQYGSTAIVDSTDAKYQVIGNSMQSALDKTANNIALNPKQYDLGRKNMLDMIDAANVSASYKTEWRTRVEQSLSGALIGGRLNDGDAKAALNLIESGAYNDRLVPEDLANLKRQAESAIKADEAQRKREQRESLISTQAAGQTVIEDALSTALATGRQTLVTDDWLRNTYGGTPAGDQFVEKTRRRLRAAETQGQLAPAISSNDPEENAALLAGMAPKPGQPFTPEQAATFDLATELVNRKQAAFDGADPAAAAAENNQVLRKWWANWQADPANKPFLKTAMAMSLLEQERQNVPVEKRKPMPDAVANWIAGTIMRQANPKARLDTLLQFADLGDAESSKGVLAQIAQNLPIGTDLVIDIADPLGTGQSGDRALAERVLNALAVDTTGVELPKQASDAITSTFNAGIGAVLIGQAAITGDVGAAGGLIAPLKNASVQLAKVKILAGYDPVTAGQEAISELTKQYATISDASFAQVYYPRALENQAPGAVEAGLMALREDAAAKLKAANAEPNPYLDATVQDITDSAVWVNHGAGFALIVPGSNRFIKAVTAEEAQSIGIQRLNERAGAKRKDQEERKRKELVEERRKEPEFDQPPLLDFQNTFVPIEAFQ